MASQTISRVVIAGALACLCGGPQAQVVSGGARLQATARVIPKESEVTLNQPVDLLLAIFNGEPQTATIDLGDDRKSKITIGVGYPSGAQTEKNITTHEGAVRGGLITLRPGETYHQHLILEDWVTLQQTGTYRIEVKLDSSIRLESGDSYHVEPIFARVVVKPRDEQALERFCEKTLGDLLSAENYADADHAAEMLSYVRDTAAVPYLQRAFVTPYSVHSILVGGLERIGTDGAAEALLDSMANNKGVAPEATREALTKFASKTSNATLAARIRQALSSQ